MKTHRLLPLASCALAVAASSLCAQTDTPQEGAVYDAQLRKIAADYSTRIESATTGLNEARERIAEEKIPLLNQMRAAEDDILSLRAELANLRRDVAEFANDRTRREQEASAQRLNISYFAGAASEGLTTLNSTLGNVEMGTWKERVEDLRNRLDPVGGVPDITAAVESAELLAGRLESLLGGYIAPGMAVEEEARELQQGHFVYLGPETFFVAEDPAGVSGTVRARDEGAAPLVYALPGWTAEQARALVDGRATSVPADVSGGKALQLRASQGTWIDHINKGGVVGYSILGLGLFAALTGIVKMIDLNSLSVDAPAKTTSLLKTLATEGPKAAENALEGLRKTSRELFATGLRNGFKPKEVIEEHLHAYILRERLHHERWLPMLAVIAAASPLLGLLGTVVGMVKTFTLITVFGTGNAGKLSSGISEALVTTQLGLTVAIPTLVLHGFLSYRTQKNLSLLERYGVEFITASEDHRVSQSESA